MWVLYVGNFPRWTANSFHLYRQLRCWFCELSSFSFSFSLSVSILRNPCNCLIGTFVEQKATEIQIQIPETTLPLQLQLQPAAQVAQPVRLRRIRLRQRRVRQLIQLRRHRVRQPIQLRQPRALRLRQRVIYDSDYEFLKFDFDSHNVKQHFIFKYFFDFNNFVQLVQFLDNPRSQS